jgi:hypothetical protein
MKPKDRHISILEYFNRLQLEYLLYELRTKIYPSSDDKAKFKKVLQFKKDKINDISKKNMLISIFDDEELKRDMTEQLFGSENMPEGFNKRDKYFYYFIGSDFSYNGQGCRLISYDLFDSTAIIEKNSENISVGLIQIRRIF